MLTLLSGSLTLEVEGRTEQIVGRANPFCGRADLHVPASAHDLSTHRDERSADLFVSARWRSLANPSPIVRPADSPVRIVGVEQLDSHVWPGTSLTRGTRI